MTITVDGTKYICDKVFTEKSDHGSRVVRGVSFRGYYDPSDILVFDNNSKLATQDMEIAVDGFEPDYWSRH